ncbi:chromodomain Y-like protein [Cyclospora cayetanensis]|uniref:Chromodomain Y-like protein n=1 Tax=Cyclospora cayetanensis TaxID=88456 RepID=A0A6P6RU51_9EIME|nr:chromodomain Y-like protein [Cyclospora cayetanensis]
MNFFASFSSGGKKKEKCPVKTEEYEVDDIVAHKKERGLDYFKVRWKGFDESDDTWEVESNLAHAPMFHLKMHELKKETEHKLAEKDAEAAAQAHARKRRKHTSLESDPSRPCDVEGQEEDAEVEYRIYATGTKVPKNHLPDELALGDRLSILRFKRSAMSASSALDAQNEEEGADITVTYSIDGTDTYTIPFNAARRYCCQRLLSYLIRRTTFRSPRGSQEPGMEGSVSARSGSSNGGSPQQHSVCTAGERGSVQDCLSEPMEGSGEKQQQGDCKQTDSATYGDTATAPQAGGEAASSAPVSGVAVGLAAAATADASKCTKNSGRLSEGNNKGGLYLQHSKQRVKESSLPATGGACAAAGLPTTPTQNAAW